MPKLTPKQQVEAANPRVSESPSATTSLPLSTSSGSGTGQKGHPTSVNGLLKATTEGIHNAAESAIRTAQRLSKGTLTVSSDPNGIIDIPLEDLNGLTSAQQSAIALDQTYHELELAAKRRRLALMDSDTLPDLSPGEVLVLDIRRTHVVVNEMARRIGPMLASLPDPSKLDPDDPDYLEKQNEMFNLFVVMTAQGTKPHAFLKLMLEFQKHLTAVAKAALDADIADRLATVAEADAMDMLEVMRNILNDEEIDLTVVQRKALPPVIRRHITAFREKRARKRHMSV